MGTLVVAGGRNSDGDSRQSWAFNLVEKIWTRLPDLPFNCYQCPFFEMEGLNENEPKEEALVALDGENNYWTMNLNGGNVKNVTSSFERVEGLEGIVGTAFVDSKNTYIFAWQKNQESGNVARKEVYALKRNYHPCACNGHGVARLDLSCPTSDCGGKSGERVYTLPSGTTVISSANTYTHQDYYY